MPTQIQVRVKVSGIAPRLTFMSTTQWLGATLGATAQLPLVEKKAGVSVLVGPTTFNTPLGPAAEDQIASGIGASIRQQANALTSSRFGVGDLEIAPILRWTRDPEQILLAMFLSLPTGEYNKNRTANPGAGNFYTVRPLVQYSYIGNGWDVAGRAAYSMNSRNKDTKYRSGNYLNVDVSLMKSLSDSLRVGAAGYALVQTTEDTAEGTPTLAQRLTVGKKGQVFGIGPSFAWIKGAGDWLVDARLLKEFSAQDRPEGASFWLNWTLPIR